ncbi:uncharacterized protein LY89DRAFT_332794 [Mollisia scopiformis]|uniref:Zn(2)-C6 fungal-type domain-containing protein n=1 Tax=Mollisia scopiformis TaxID=149040 RepID=A0A132B9I6_MOLSC|nr:uncharacterized protein LY89DRAFT_332794 [Mollisia scopiformis]KUJ08534.1 hypothetical protein LY89DRAFT_332794 [Mollisia scopiformis]
MPRNELRSKTGCMSCRRRKKKCDEKRPACGGCSRSFLTCQWPTEEQNALDRRYRKGLNHPSAKSQEVKLQETAIGFKWDESALLAYFGNTVAPSYIQKGSHPHFHSMDSVFSLVEKHDTAKHAIMNCAATSLSGNFTIDRDWTGRMRSHALSLRISAIAEIQRQIKSGIIDGTEDWLLLSATQLALADSFGYNISTPIIHMHGIMSLLRCRQFARTSNPELYRPSTESLVHERISYEALLFHGITLMLFNREFYMLNQPWWHTIDEYFRSAPLSIALDEASWPILGMPFSLFRLAVLAHELNRQCPLSKEGKQLAISSLLQLNFFHKYIPSTGYFSAGYTYLAATTALLRNMISRSGNDIEVPEEAHEAPKTDISKIEANINAKKFFIRYPLWPLAVLYRVSEVEAEKKTLERLIEDALRNIRGVVFKPPPRKAVAIFMMTPGL